ncbi:hypothetical protein BJ742DRAFT_92480 [Cladochytrium replicatum]|nr:hypothetical protein BJ742DRAFT_92480 [Cladochytrium replicatum]
MMFVTSLSILLLATLAYGEVSSVLVYKPLGCFKDSPNPTGPEHVLRTALIQTSVSAAYSPIESCLIECQRRGLSICGLRAGDGAVSSNGSPTNYCLGDVYTDMVWNSRGNILAENCQRPCNPTNATIAGAAGAYSKSAADVSIGGLRCGGALVREPTLSMFFVGLGDSSTKLTYTESVADAEYASIKSAGLTTDQIGPSSSAYTKAQNNAKFVGCYYSTRRYQGANGQLVNKILLSDATTPELCLSTCAFKNYPFCGIDWSAQRCWGGGFTNNDTAQAQLENDLTYKKAGGPEACTAVCQFGGQGGAGNSTNGKYLCGGWDDEGFKMAVYRVDGKSNIGSGSGNGGNNGGQSGNGGSGNPGNENGNAAKNGDGSNSSEGALSLAAVIGLSCGAVFVFVFFLAALVVGGIRRRGKQANDPEKPLMAFHDRPSAGPYGGGASTALGAGVGVYTSSDDGETQRGRQSPSGPRPMPRHLDTDARTMESPTTRNLNLENTPKRTNSISSFLGLLPPIRPLTPLSVTAMFGNSQVSPSNSARSTPEPEVNSPRSRYAGLTIVPAIVVGSPVRSPSKLSRDTSAEPGSPSSRIHVIRKNSNHGPKVESTTAAVESSSSPKDAKSRDDLTSSWTPRFLDLVNPSVALRAAAAANSARGSWLSASPSSPKVADLELAEPKDSKDGSTKDQTVQRSTKAGIVATREFKPQSKLGPQKSGLSQSVGSKSNRIGPTPANGNGSTKRSPQTTSVAPRQAAVDPNPKEIRVASSILRRPSEDSDVAENAQSPPRRVAFGSTSRIDRTIPQETSNTMTR